MMKSEGEEEKSATTDCIGADGLARSVGVRRLASAWEGRESLQGVFAHAPMHSQLLDEFWIS